MQQNRILNNQKDLIKAFFESSNSQAATFKKRNVIVVGKTGAGKSNLLNRLLNENGAFKVSSSVESVTSEIKSHLKSVEFEIQYQEIFRKKVSYNLECFDTPGLADSKGRSKDFLNQIARTIQSKPFNQIIILVEFGRLDTGLFNNLEVLSECLNDLPDSSAMLIVNKVPTKQALENKRKMGQMVPDLDKELEITYNQVSQALNTTFSKVMFLENEDYEPEINDSKYNQIKKVIWSSKLFNAKNVKTWDEILEFYEKDIKDLTNRELEIKRQVLISNNQEKLANVEFEIAHIKYPYLEGKEFEECSSEEKIIWNFECKYTREQYLDLRTDDKDLPFFFDKNGEFKSGTKALLFFSLLPYTLGYAFIARFRAKINSLKDLKKLDKERNKLKSELNEYKLSIDCLRNKISMLREKIICLEAALINKNQIQHFRG